MTLVRAQGPALGLGVYLRADPTALRPRSPAFLRWAWMRVSGGSGPEVELAAFPLVRRRGPITAARALPCGISRRL